MPRNHACGRAGFAGVCRFRDHKCGSVSGMPTGDLFSDPPEPTVIDDPALVDAYLVQHVGVTSAELGEALDFGTAEAGTVTEHAALSSFGTRLWDGALTSLRDQLVPKGWKVARPGGLEVVRRADETLQITPSMGNEATGIRDETPSCKYDRGLSSAAAVERNQLSLADLAPEDEAWQTIRTWWLLYYVFPREGERWIRAELSLPTAVDGGRFVSWSHRLVLSERPFGTVEPVVIPDASPEPELTLPRRSANE